MHRIFCKHNFLALPSWQLQALFRDSISIFLSWVKTFNTHLPTFVALVRIHSRMRKMLPSDLFHIYQLSYLPRPQHWIYNKWDFLHCTAASEFLQAMDFWKKNKRSVFPKIFLILLMDFLKTFRSALTIHWLEGKLFSLKSSFLTQFLQIHWQREPSFGSDLALFVGSVWSCSLDVQKCIRLHRHA